MRDSERISKILYDIGRVWEMFPDLTLGQLLLNVAPDPILYYIEDDELVHYLREFGYNTAKEILKNNGET